MNTIWPSSFRPVVVNWMLCSAHNHFDLVFHFSIHTRNAQTWNFGFGVCEFCFLRCVFVCVQFWFWFFFFLFILISKPFKWSNQWSVFIFRIHSKIQIQMIMCGVLHTKRFNSSTTFVYYLIEPSASIATAKIKTNKIK